MWLVYCREGAAKGVAYRKPHGELGITIIQKDVKISLHLSLNHHFSFKEKPLETAELNPLVNKQETTNRKQTASSPLVASENTTGH